MVSCDHIQYPKGDYTDTSLVLKKLLRSTTCNPSEKTYQPALLKPAHALP